MPRTLLSGNEAIARGAWEAGVIAGLGYPGTPSTEVLENLTRLSGVRCEWAPNEKVALEVAAGVSLAGGRSIVTMKHVGLNVAADPLFTLAYTGVLGGLVVLVADDPGMHSSQNEQDSRFYGLAAKLPVLEPSDSAEALAMVRDAFEISERFDTPVLLRTTTRLAHSKGLVEVGERAEVPLKREAPQAAKWVMMPGMARARRREMEGRLERLTAYAEECAFNRAEMRDRSLGVVCSGVVYEHVREALPEASVLKLAVSNPLPERLVREFAAQVDRLAVVEELSPMLATRLRALGLEVDTPVGYIGELTPLAVARAFGSAEPETREPERDLPPRPPMLCAGCPHRGVFHALREMGALVTGDIGCYTLGALPPLSAISSCVDMGASVGMAHGIEIAERTLDAEEPRPVVGVIGDSTFAHSGLTGLLNTVYNGGSSTLVILDNRTTAMTGHQGNPVSGTTLSGEDAPALDLAAVCRALGVTDVVRVNPHRLKAVGEALRAALENPGPSVVIAEAPCVLLKKSAGKALAVDAAKCAACGKCVLLACPAISKTPTGKATIDASQCVGCSQCVQVCDYRAIRTASPACEAGEAS